MGRVQALPVPFHPGPILRHPLQNLHSFTYPLISIPSSFYPTQHPLNRVLMEGLKQHRHALNILLIQDPYINPFKKDLSQCCPMWIITILLFLEVDEKFISYIDDRLPILKQLG